MVPGSDKAVVADPPQADANSKTVIIGKEQKRTNLCWSLNNSLLRICISPGHGFDDVVGWILEKH